MQQEQQQGSSLLPIMHDQQQHFETMDTEGMPPPQIPYHPKFIVRTVESLLRTFCRLYLSLYIIQIT